MKYIYFYGEMVVEKDNKGQIRGFGFWMENAGDRQLEEHLISDYRARTGKFLDNYSGETYSRGEAHTVILHHSAGTETYTGIAAWALAKYHGFLKSFARSQCRNSLNNWADRPDF